MHEYGQDAQAGHESYYSKWERPWERLVDVRHTHTHTHVRLQGGCGPRHVGRL